MRKSVDIESDLRTLARKMGLGKFDVFGSLRSTTQVKVEAGKPGLISSNDAYRFTVRVWNNRGQIGVASTTDVSQDGLSRAMQLASEASVLSQAQDAPTFSPLAAKRRDVGTNGTEPPAPPVAQMLQVLLDAEKQLMKKHSAISAVPYNALVCSYSRRIYINSEDCLLEESFPGAFTYLYPKAQEEGRRPRGSSAIRFAKEVDSLDIPGCINEAAEKIVSHLAYERVATGTYPVVFAPRAFLSLLGAFENFINARAILDRNSLITREQLHTLLASPLLSIADDPTRPENILNPIRFDEEGSPTGCTQLLENGRLVGLLHSAQTAAAFGTQPTGNAVTGSKVMVEPSFWVVERGENPPTEMLVNEQQSTIIYIDELKSLHAGVAPRQGSFSLPFDGWVIENGKHRSIESATVAGDFLSMLRGVTFVGNQATVTTNGICPEIWIANLSITGE